MSATRAWFVGHDGFRVAAALVGIGLAGSAYTFVRVPVPYGGRVPVWFLIPPALAMFAALAVHNELPVDNWMPRTIRRARMAWAVAVTGLVALAAALVGFHAGQGRMPELAGGLTSLTFGLAVLVGRGSAVLGASCLVVIIVSTRSLHHLTPASVWALLGPVGHVVAALLCAACLTAYSCFGSRSPWAASTG